VSSDEWIETEKKHIRRKIIVLTPCAPLLLAKAISLKGRGLKGSGRAQNSRQRRYRV